MTSEVQENVLVASRRLTDEWLQTELSDNHCDDPFEHRASFNALLEFASLGLCTSLLLLTCHYLNLSFLWGIGPLSLYHAYSLSKTVLQIKTLLQDGGPLLVFKKIRYQVAYLVFCGCLGLYWTHWLQYFSYSMLALAACAFSKPWLATPSLHEGENWLRTVNFRQVLMFSEWLLVAEGISVGIKLDFYPEWDLLVVAWAVWIGLGLSLIFSVISLYYLAAMLQAYCQGKQDFTGVLLISWLAISLTGFSVSCGINCYCFLIFGDVVTPLCTNIVFCVGFLTFTQVLYTPILMWWDSLWFMQYEYARSPLVLPPSQHALINCCKPTPRTPPKLLKRVSATYFKRVDSVDTCEMANPAAEEQLCKICFATESDAVLMECGHGGLCFACAQEVFHSQGHCCLCRAEVTQVLKVKDNQKNGYSVVSVLST